jgi:MFS family permease
MGSKRTVVAALCAAEVLAMAGTMSFQALIPTFITEWRLTHSEVGWISGIAYAAYVAGVPILVSLTDRIDARRIVIAFCLVAAVSSVGFAWFAQGFWSALAFRALGGLALGGTYMPGLKALTDRIEGRSTTRYQSFYTASFSVGSSVSLFTTGMLADRHGWPLAFAAAGIAPLLAVLVLALWVPPVTPARRGERDEALLDFRPVLRQRESMSYILGYAAHCWELFAFRTWLVAFMTFTAVAHASALAGSTITTVASAILLLGLPASVLGNEVATRFGRRRVLIAFMLASIVLAAVIGDAGQRLAHGRGAQRRRARAARQHARRAHHAWHDHGVPRAARLRFRARSDRRRRHGRVMGGVLSRARGRNRLWTARSVAPGRTQPARIG